MFRIVYTLTYKYFRTFYIRFILHSTQNKFFKTHISGELLPGKLFWQLFQVFLDNIHQFNPIVPIIAKKIALDHSTAIRSTNIANENQAVKIRERYVLNYWKW